VSFTAKYAGDCADCPVRIEPGDEVAYNSVDELTHVICPDASTAAAKPHPVCGQCFLEHPADKECDW
jgi:hypothetical protein